MGHHKEAQLQEDDRRNAGEDASIKLGLGRRCEFCGTFLTDWTRDALKDLADEDIVGAFSAHTRGSPEQLRASLGALLDATMNQCAAPHARP